MIDKYIKAILFEHDCVVLPGFGGFLTHYVSADIHPITHKFNPPSRKIAFNEQLKNNDGLLADWICKTEAINRADANKRIDEYVKKIKESLQTTRFYEMKEVGRFFYNRENLLEFEPEGGVNYLEDSYALPELFFKPIDRTITTMNKTAKPVKPSQNIENGDYAEEKQVKRTSPVLIILPIILLILGGATAFMYFNQDNQQIASFNPFVMFSSGEEAKTSMETAVKEESVSTEQPVAEENVNMDPATAPAEITPENARYYIVVGSFTDRANAEKMVRKYGKKDIAASIVEPKGDQNLFRVSIADYDNKKVAKARLYELQKTHGKKIWILTN